jgi:hypothetical protein
LSGPPERLDPDDRRRHQARHNAPALRQLVISQAVKLARLGLAQQVAPWGSSLAARSFAAISSRPFEAGGIYFLARRISNVFYLKVKYLFAINPAGYDP